MAHPARHPPLKPLVRAALHWLTALIVGIIVALLLSGLSYLPIAGRYVRLVETHGKDVGMWLASRWQEIPNDPKYKYVLVDVDQAVCQMLFGSDALRCSTSRADREVTAAVISAVRQSKARVAVLDILSDWSLPPIPDPLAEAFKASSTTPLVAPLFVEFQPDPGSKFQKLKIRPRWSGPTTAENTYYAVPISPISRDSEITV